jgi:hypothetical protein
MIQSHPAHRYCAVITFDDSPVSLDEMQLSSNLPTYLLLGSRFHTSDFWQAGTDSSLIPEISGSWVASSIPSVFASEKINPQSSNGDQ